MNRVIVLSFFCFISIFSSPVFSYTSIKNNTQHTEITYEIFRDAIGNPLGKITGKVKPGETIILDRLDPLGIFLERKKLKITADGKILYDNQHLSEPYSWRNLAISVENTAQGDIVGKMANTFLGFEGKPSLFGTTKHSPSTTTLLIGYASSTATHNKLSCRP